MEYIAGTFAGDATEVFTMAITEKLENSVRLEFFGITGKTYTIESSPDLKTWKRVNFSVSAAGPGAPGYLASDVGPVSVFTSPGSALNEYYRLSVR